jgi:hypothetical protein
MQTQGALWMTQRDRDRLVTLKKAKKRLITQKQAAEELRISERQVRRLLRALKARGDGAVIHGLRGGPSNRRISEKKRRKIVEVLGQEVYRGFGPTLASEHLERRCQMRIGREALRKLMIEAGLWKARKQKVEEVHLWRPRRSRFGELVQWDTSDHEWLEGRGPQIYLIHMLDDATSRLRARFVEHDSTEENLGMLRGWLEKYGRMGAVYTDKASMFHTTEKTGRGQERGVQDPQELAPTQIGRALEEFEIGQILAHSPQAKGRVERSFDTAQDRLVKELRVAGACTLEEANRVLEEIFLPWWEKHCTVQPAQADDAHRRLGKEHNLDAILSVVEKRQVLRDYTFRLQGKLYQIERSSIYPGLRGGQLRVEQRLDGSLAVAFRGRYLGFAPCSQPKRMEIQERVEPSTAPKKRPRSRWMDHFDLHKAPPIGQAIQGPRSAANDRLR